MTQRILPLEKGHNFRELGGYQTTDGRTLKWHKLLRSANLAHLTDADLNYLDQYGLRYDIDLRSEDEKAKAPDRLPANATYEFLPVFAVDETANSASQDELYQLFSKDPLSGHTRMQKVYDNLINQPHSKQAYRRFFELLLANDQDHQTTLSTVRLAKIGPAWPLSSYSVPLMCPQRRSKLITCSLTSHRLILCRSPYSASNKRRPIKAFTKAFNPY